MSLEAAHARVRAHTHIHTHTGNCHHNQETEYCYHPRSLVTLCRPAFSLPFPLIYFVITDWLVSSRILYRNSCNTYSFV